MKHVFIFLLTFSSSLLMTSFRAEAIDKDWTGATDSNWNTASNWSPAGVPTVNDRVTIPSGTNSPVITDGTTATARTIQLQSNTLRVSSGGVLTITPVDGDAIGLDINNGVVNNNGSVTVQRTTGNVLTVGIYTQNTSQLINTGTVTVRVNFRAYGVINGNFAIINSVTGTILLDAPAASGNFANMGIVNSGVIRFSGGESSLENSGTLTLGIANCSKFITEGSFSTAAGSILNAGLFQVGGTLTTSGSFTNNGVLKYAALSGSVTNNQVIVNNDPTPIFTYGGSAALTVDGIYTDANATTLAGTFTAPNSFMASASLPSGLQTLYAKLTPSGEACSYVVPFTYRVKPALSNLMASPNPVCVGQAIQFTATLGNVSGGYSYTLTNGSSTSLTGTATSTAFSQSLTASGSGNQTFSLLVSSGGERSSATVGVTVKPVPNAAFSGLTSPYCANAGAVTLTPTTSGGTFSGPGISGTTFTPANAGTGGVVSYSLTVGGCTNSSSQTVTVNPLPQAPMIATQSGHSYPGGVASLTISQNTGNIILMASGCSGGTISWAGGNSSTLAVSTFNTGVQTFTATCTSNSTGCTSPQATATVTVVPTTLSVLHRDATNSQLSTNTLAPYLQLQNNGNTAIPYSEITVRYFLTLENPAPLQFQINYAQLGTDKVHLRYVSAPTGNPGATGYIEFSFDASAGSLGTGQNSGPIQDLINKQDFSFFDQSNDYSYVNTGSFTPNPRITAYRNGTIFYGLEPGPIMAVQSVKALLQNNTGSNANTIAPVLQVVNDGSLPINYGDLKVRYYFTADNNQPLVVNPVGYMPLGSGNVMAQIGTISPPLANADRYVEVSFSSGLGSLAPGSNTGNLNLEIRHADYSPFNQLNDYSYQSTGAMMVNPHVVVFIGGARAYGTEPGAAARLSGERAETPLRVQVLGNPVQSSGVEVVVSGAEGLPLTLSLTDLSGRSVTTRQVERAGATESQRLEVGTPPTGMLLLRVSTPTQSQTVKLLSH